MSPALPALTRRISPPRLVALAAALSLVAVTPAHAAAPYVPGEVVVAYASAPPVGATHHARTATARPQASSWPRVLRLPANTGVAVALARLRHQRGVLWAVPDYIAHAAALGPAARVSSAAAVSMATPFVPDDPGAASKPGGWEATQWNFAGPFGVGAPQAWGNLAADGAPGGRGVVVAVLDTGIAYKNWRQFRRSPDLLASQFVRGYDFVTRGAYPVDHNGHGTHVASTIAEATNNGYGLTGLAYGARLMPVRVLDSSGAGDASVIARGVRFATDHGARVINLSLEFDSGITAADIPELIQALHYARRRGVLVVAAAGNEGSRTIAYPARVPTVIAVGATTEHGCLSDFSNDGRHLSLVAPGGGADANLPGDPNCHPLGPTGRDIDQVTFLGASPQRFGVPAGYDGTSMAAPHVSATVALIIASRVLGSHPSPAAIEARLKATATPLGDAADRYRYGAGLLNAAAATAPGGPGAVR